MGHFHESDQVTVKKNVPATLVNLSRVSLRCGKCNPQNTALLVSKAGFCKIREKTNATILYRYAGNGKEFTPLPKH